VIRIACRIIYVNFILTTVCISELQIFFYIECEYSSLAVCLVIRLSRFYLVTEIISLRLE
jgi:hypothetical protein